MVPSIHELASLHRQGLVGDDDLVRAESGSSWVRAGAMPALVGRRERRRERRWLWSVLFAAVALVAALALLQAGRSRGTSPRPAPGQRP
jgi:hypothetical protein